MVYLRLLIANSMEKTGKGEKTGEFRFLRKLRSGKRAIMFFLPFAIPQRLSTTRDETPAEGYHHLRADSVIMILRLKGRFRMC
jgi:hypothetical protein